MGNLTDDDATGFFEPGIVAFSARYVERVFNHELWRGPDVELVSDWDELELVWAADINWLEDPSTSSDNEDPFDIPFLPEL